MPTISAKQQTSLQQKFFSFLFRCQALPHKIISVTQAINYYISRKSACSSCQQINNHFLTARLWLRLVIKCMVSGVTLVLEIWIPVISKTWFVLEIWFTLVSEIWFILEPWIAMVPETWAVLETSIRTVSESLTMRAKIVTRICRSKIWIILASKSQIMPTKIALHVHGSKCCKIQGDNRWQNVKTQTEHIKAQCKQHQSNLKCITIYNSTFLPSCQKGASCHSLRRHVTWLILLQETIPSTIY